MQHQENFSVFEPYKQSLALFQANPGRVMLIAFIPLLASCVQAILLHALAFEPGSAAEMAYTVGFWFLSAFITLG